MKKIRPFSQGSQAAEWISRNCENCEKKFRHDQRQYHCRWQKELDVAYMTTGEISEKCAEAIGITPALSGFYTWDCPSLVKPGDPPRTKQRRVVPGQYNLFRGGTNGD